MTRERAKEKALAAVVTRYQDEIASLKQSLAEAEGQIRHLEQRISGLGKIADADRAIQTAAKFWNEMILKHFRQREDRPGYEIDWNEIGEALAKAILAAEERGARGQWQPIDTANKWTWEENPSAPPILIGRFYHDRVLWMMAATYGVSTYGDIHCASRAGWRGDTMPQMAYGPNKARPVEWIMDSPTHWMPLPPLPSPQEGE